jgi:hypothetical protein
MQEIAENSQVLVVNSTTIDLNFAIIIRLLELAVEFIAISSSLAIIVKLKITPWLVVGLAS